MAESVLITDPRVIFLHSDMDNSCSASPLWDNWYPRIRIAVFAIFMLNYLFIVPGFMLYARRKNAKARWITPYYAFIPAVVFMVLYVAYSVSKVQFRLWICTDGFFSHSSGISILIVSRSVLWDISNVSVPERVLSPTKLITSKSTPVSTPCEMLQASSSSASLSSRPPYF